MRFFQGETATLAKSADSGAGGTATGADSHPARARSIVGVVTEGGADAVLQALEQIAAQTPEQAQAMRQAAQTRWAERCRNAALLAQLFPEAQG